MYTSPGVVEMVDVPIPTPGPGEVRVRIGATGICGSDVHGFLGRQARRQPGLVLGHETMGVVESTGVGAPTDLVGQRVAVNPLLSCGSCGACRSGRQNCCATWRLLGLDRVQGAFSEFVVVPARNVHLIPDHVTDAEAVMVEPLANAVHLVNRIPTGFGLMPKAVVLGAGTLGACILRVAQLRGLPIVAVSEPNPLRAGVAAAMGAPAIIDPIHEDPQERIMSLTDGEGVPVVFDAVGRESTRTLAVSVLCKGGAAMLLGMDEGPTTFDFQNLIRREIQLTCSYAYTETDYAEALAMVVRGEIDFSRWTDVAPMIEGQSCFDRLAKDPGDRIKIVLTP
jgi:2-desacetyl-2-hydroxyethyl bacteriochlorophyllide A dehydrogenase